MTVRDIVLGVDLDEVVFEYIVGLRELIRDSGREVPDNEPTSWSMEEAGWFPTDEAFKKFHGDAVEDGLYEKLKLTHGAHEVLWDLSDAGYQINIITSRFVNPGQHRKVVSQTVASLDRWDLPYSNISFLDNKVLFKADAYIDDSPRNVNNLVDANRFVIRKVMNYNKDCKGVPAINLKEARQILRDHFGR